MTLESTADETNNGCLTDRVQERVYTIPSSRQFDTMSASMCTLPKAPGFTMPTAKTGRSKAEL